MMPLKQASLKFKIQNESGDWFTLDGKKLSDKPSAKGIYIHNGTKVVIK